MASSVNSEEEKDRKKREDEELEKKKTWYDLETADNEEDEFLVMIKGKGRTEEEVLKIRREQEGRQKSSDKNKKRNERRRVNRHHPWDGAERKLINTNNMTNRAGGEGPSTTTQAPSSSTPIDKYAPTKTNRLIPEQTFTLTVYRKDNQPVTRDDIFTLDAEIGLAEIDNLEKNGTNKHNITWTGRKGQNFVLCCNNLEAEKFYQNAIDNTTELSEGHKGYKSYRHDEKRPGHQIVGFVHSTHWRYKDKMHMAFCAGTEGKVDPTQVTQYRPPRQETGGMIKIFLELDNEAFEWLRTVDWKSRIGGLTVPWRAPNISGLTGIFRPDEDVEAIKTALIASYNNITAADIPKTTSTTAPNTGISTDIELLDCNSVKSIDTGDIDTHIISGDEEITELNKTVRPATPSGKEAEMLNTPRKNRQKIRKKRTTSDVSSDVSDDLESKLD